MQATLARGVTVARKAGRPKKPSGKGKAVRIDPDLASKARIVALRRAIPLSDYLSEVLRAPITRDYRKTLQELDEKDQREK
jgi:hypothetical protein